MHRARGLSQHGVLAIPAIPSGQPAAVCCPCPLVWADRQVAQGHEMQATDHAERIDRQFYNDERLHQALGYPTPAQVYGVAS
jgi:hypothetical protein